MDSVFEQSMKLVFEYEAGFTDNPSDNGNWTGGKVGVGKLNGSNFGISAASYPDLDIRNLTRDRAYAIYKRDYWDKFQCDKLPPPLAFMVFDVAVNGGRPIQWLQTAVGVTPDGVLGPLTLAKLPSKMGNLNEVMARFLQARILYMTSLSTWPTFKGGWSYRLASLPFLAMTIKAAP